jgi:hypothetical protein
MKVRTAKRSMLFALIALAGTAAMAQRVAAQDCVTIQSLLSQGHSAREVARMTGSSLRGVESCRTRSGRTRAGSAAGPPPHGAAGPPPHGAAGPPPIGAPGPPPIGAAGPAPHGAAGPPPHGAAGPPP